MIQPEFLSRTTSFAEESLMEEVVSIIEDSLKKGMPFTEAVNAVLTVAIGLLPKDAAVSKMLEATQSAAWINGDSFEYNILPTQIDQDALH